MHKDQFSDPHQFKAWRASKLAHQTEKSGAEVINIKNPEQLSRDETSLIEQSLKRHNYVIYQSESRHWNKEQLVKFGQSFGLNEFDKHLFGIAGVSDICVTENNVQGEFIPYTNRRLGWHTDGYYNPNKQWVSSIILHCNQAAKEGGINRFVDPDMLYIHLHDTKPELIAALMADDCMFIPGYDDGAGYHRPASKGPVFWFNAHGHLQMRYTQRQRNIEWSGAPLVHEARELIYAWLEDSDNVVSHKLLTGQGVLSNNVLHCRTSFQDTGTHPRHLLRARYLDSIRLTEDQQHD